MEVSAGTTQASLPLTFGQPFRAGDLPSTSGLIATDSNGASVPLQMDEVSSHTDGSVRFAVLSTQLSNLQASQPRIVNFFKAAKSTSRTRGVRRIMGTAQCTSGGDGRDGGDGSD